MRILVIDDNSNSLQSLCLVLKDLGHEPRGMEDPVAALAVARKEYFPLIITDIRMPGLSGLELLTELKNDPFTKPCDVVLITGHGDMATAVEALRKGAYDYLNKPINARELSAGKGERLSHLVGDNATPNYSPTKLGSRKDVVWERLILDRGKRRLCGCRRAESKHIRERTVPAKYAICARIRRPSGRCKDS